MMNIVLLGPPAVGKGTLAARLEQDFALKPISAGELLRAEVQAGTDLGKRAEPIMAQGGFLPDDMVVELIARRMAEPDCANGVLFDGFPRTLGQAQALDSILAKHGRPLTSVIQMEADEATITARFHKRVAETIARGEEPRKDDNAETFARRIKNFYAETIQVVTHYQAQGVLDVIDATQPIADGLRDVYNALAMRGCRPKVTCNPSTTFAPVKPGNAPTPL